MARPDHIDAESLQKWLESEFSREHCSSSGDTVQIATVTVTFEFEKKNAKIKYAFLKP